MKHSRIREMSMEVTVGAFMFMILLALGVFTIILSRESLFTQTYYMTVEFDEVMGIREGDNVYVRGVVIGKVKKIDDDWTVVRVTLALDRQLQLREDYRIEILPTSVLGGRYLYVYEGTQDAPPLPPDAVARGAKPVDLIDEATRTVTLIRDALEEGGVIKNVETSMANIAEVSTKLNEGEGTIGKLINEDEVYNDLKEITANLKDLSERLAAKESSLGRFLDDQGTLYEDVEALAKNLRETSEGLVEGKGLLGKLLAEDDTIYPDLKEAAAAIKEIAVTINSGEGTVGRLIKEDRLYEDLLLTLNEVRAAIDDFRETAPITTFTTILFGAF